MISHYRVPGVYIDYVAQKKKPELKTGIPLFVGFGELIVKSDKQWCRVTSWQHFEENFKTTLNSSFLLYAVRGFFENGGQCCIVLPLPEANATPDALLALFQDTGGVIEDIENVDLVCIPDLMMDGIWNSSKSDIAVEQVQKEVLSYCKKMGDRFAIFDTTPEPEQLDIEQTIINRYKISGSEGALYFPWVRVQSLSLSVHEARNSEVGRSHKPIDFSTIRRDNQETCFVPPCGHIAGVYARSDAKIGVFKAPANEIVIGVLDLGFLLTQNDQAKLNHAGVNCLRSSPTRGIRIWGARTLSVNEHDQFVTTRRLFFTLVRWIEKNMHDFVFESNDSSLWRRIKNRLEGYCYELFQKGALKGQSPEQAYYVKCDRELNTIETQELGRVVCEIGLASVVPAEFIVVRITQSASGAAASSLSLNLISNKQGDNYG